MRYMLMFKTVDDAEPGVPPCKDDLPEMARLIEEGKRTGVILSTEGLHPSWTGTRVAYAGGKLAVMDGPFAEAKEVVAGFAIVDVPTKEVAIEWAKKFLAVAGQGESEIRPIFEAGQVPTKG